MSLQGFRKFSMNKIIYAVNAYNLNLQYFMNRYITFEHT